MAKKTTFLTNFAVRAPLTHEAHMHVTAAEAFSAATGITYYNVHVAPKQR
jgi:hypothetical protein